MPQGGEKQSYIWLTNGSRWFIVDSLAGSRILAEAYGSIASTTWEIPESRFDAEFIEAKDLRYISQVVEHQPLAGYSYRLLREAYAGFANLVRRSTDDTTQDIGFIDAFDYNVAEFNAFIAGGDGFNRTWYDQFGAVNAIQSTLAQQPVINPTQGSNSRPANLFDGANDKMTANALAASFSGVDAPFTFLCLARANNFAATYSMTGLGNSADNNPIIAHQLNSTPLHQIQRRDDAGVSDVLTAQVPTVDVYSIWGVMYDQSDMHFIQNGQVTTVAPATLGATTLNRFTIGALVRIAAGQHFPGAIDECLYWNQAVGLEDLQQASFNMSQFYVVY